MAQSFLIPDSTWLDIVGKIAAIGSARTAWVVVESEFVKMSATACRIQVDEQQLYFHLLPTTPQNQTPIELLLSVPDEDAVFDKRQDENGEIRLSMNCLVKWHQN